MIFLLINLLSLILTLIYLFFFPYFLIDVILFSIIFFIIFFIINKKYLINFILPSIFFMLFSLTISNIFIQSDQYKNYCAKIFSDDYCYIFFGKIDELKIKRVIKNEKFPNEIFIK
jgi:hypothetical protein